MKYCGYCGAENQDTDVVCGVCGAPFQDMYAMPPKKSGGKALRIAAIAVGGIAALALVVVAIVGAVRLFGKSEKITLGAAGGKTFALLEEQLEEKSDLIDVFETLGERVESGEFSGSFEMTADMYTLKSDFDYSRRRKAVSGTADVTVSILGFNLDLGFAADEKCMQFTFDKDGYNVYGFSYQDRAGDNSGSVVSQLLDEILPTNVTADMGKQLFAEKSGAEDMMGEEFKRFVSSVKVYDMDDREMEIGGRIQKVSVYRVAWDRAAADEFLNSAGSNGQMSGFGQWIAGVMPKLDPECLCFVNRKGQLVGVDFVSAGRQFVFLLEGRENLWDEFTLTEKTLSGETTRYSGRIAKDGSTVYTYLQNESKVLLSASYNDVTGDFSVSTYALGEILSGNMHADKNEVSVTLQGYMSGLGQQSVSFTLSKLEKKPEMLAENYRDLMDMGLADQQRLLMDLRG